jgi:hypothetical protein
VEALTILDNTLSEHLPQTIAKVQGIIVSKDGLLIRLRLHGLKSLVAELQGNYLPAGTGAAAGDPATQLNFVYDAWNRLMMVKDETDTTFAWYRYDGQRGTVAITPLQGQQDVFESEREDHDREMAEAATAHPGPGATRHFASMTQRTAYSMEGR